MQEKIFYRVGGDKPWEVDFRLICATNRDPMEAVKDGSLREDLYYRMNTIEIRIPPLRERTEDIPMLAEHFLQMYGEKYGREDIKFERSAYDQMLNYSWRGNVRELQNVIERAVLLSKSSKITSLDVAGGNGMMAAAAPPTTTISYGGISETSGIADMEYGTEMIEKFGDVIVNKLPEPEGEKNNSDLFDALESGIVLAALRRTKGNKQAAANLLGLYRPRLYGMIKRHNLEERIS